eukprot:TRINITY_DN36938_c0_g1_i1.p1 TRINITY_DN36938_c0_g1~~TRINITY_DN36938_c0_g1_i1.p1  ORF type:complete len:198 (+),score=45.04 TRINITY_DN36938_c0_g1_i1:51-596(+)
MTDNQHWRARLEQLLKWAVAEEKFEGDIHFSLCCYTEAVLLVYRKLWVKGGSEAERKAAQPYLVSWASRALLMQAVVAEDGTGQSRHPLLKPIPKMCNNLETETISVSDDVPTVPSPQNETANIRSAAEALDLPLPPTFEKEEEKEEAQSTHKDPETFGSGNPNDEDFAAVLNTFLKKHEK